MLVSMLQDPSKAMDAMICSHLKGLKLCRLKKKAYLPLRESFALTWPSGLQGATGETDHGCDLVCVFGLSQVCEYRH